MHDIRFQDVLKEQPLFREFDAPTLDLLAGCSRNEHFAVGAKILREREPADRFYLIREGQVAIEIAAPGREAMTVETLREGEVMGWSWMIPPYRWSATGRVTKPVRAVSLDAVCLRRKCDENPALGYSLFKAFLPVIARRMLNQRLQLLNLYGKQATG